jgi:hypothetical protein
MKTSKNLDFPPRNHVRWLRSLNRIRYASLTDDIFPPHSHSLLTPVGEVQAQSANSTILFVEPLQLQ